MVTGGAGLIGMLVSWHMIGKYGEMQQQVMRAEEIIAHNSKYLNEARSHEYALDSHRRDSDILSLREIANTTKAHDRSPKFLFPAETPVHDIKPAPRFAWNQPAQTTPTHNEFSQNEESRFSTTPSVTPHSSASTHEVENQHAVAKKAIEERIYQYQQAIKGAQNYCAQFPPLGTIIQRNKWAIGSGISSCIIVLASTVFAILESTMYRNRLA